MANGTDAEGNVLKAILVSNVSHGTLTLNTNDGSFVYVHDGSETTNDSFTYQANDGLTNSGIATVTITVTAVNDAPVANNDSYTVAEGGALKKNAAGGGLDNDTDANRNELKAILVSNVRHGTLTLNTNDWSCVSVHDGSATTNGGFSYNANEWVTHSRYARVAIPWTRVH